MNPASGPNLTFWDPRHLTVCPRYFELLLSATRFCGYLHGGMPFIEESGGLWRSTRTERRITGGYHHPCSTFRNNRLVNSGWLVLGVALPQARVPLVPVADSEDTSPSSALAGWSVLGVASPRARLPLDQDRESKWSPVFCCSCKTCPRNNMRGILQVRTPKHWTSS